MGFSETNIHTVLHTAGVFIGTTQQSRTQIEFSFKLPPARIHINAVITIFFFFFFGNADGTALNPVHTLHLLP